jgi:hypothetical protein
MRGNLTDPRTSHKNLHSIGKTASKLQDEHRELALPELLGTPKGMVALAEFIKDSLLREKNTYARDSRHSTTNQNPWHRLGG